MKKIIAIFAALLFAGEAMAAYQIRRAEAVQAAPAEAGAAGLMGALSQPGGLAATALGVVGTVTQLRTQTTALRRECEPTAGDVSFVNQMVQEYARIGRGTAEELIGSLQVHRCLHGHSFESSVAQGTQADECVDVFTNTGNTGRIWYNYPRAANSRRVCPANNQNCNMDRDGVVFSNVYRIYMALGWQVDELLPNEIANHNRLVDRSQTCDPAAVRQRTAQATLGAVMGLAGQAGGPATGQTATGVTGMVQTMGAAGSGGMGALQGVMGLAPALLGAGGLGGI